MRKILIIALTIFFFAPTLRASLENPTLKEYHYLGQFYLQVGQYEQAIKNYEELIRKYPRSREAEEAWLSIGGIYTILLEKKQVEQAQKLAGKDSLPAEIQRVQAETEALKRKALNAYQTVVDTFPNSAGLALVRIGRIYAFHSPLEEELGRVKFREAMNYFPEEAGRAALFLGDSYLQQRKLEEAKTAYYQARLSYPEIAAQAQLLFSRVNQEQKDFSAVVEDLSLVLNQLGIDGFFSEYRYHGNVMQEAIDRTAKSMVAEGNPEFATEHLKSKIDSFPDTNVGLQTQLKLAEAYHEQGQGDKARVELDRLISNYPRSLYAAQAYLTKAEIGNGENALRDYEALRSAFPRSIYWVKASRALAEGWMALAAQARDDKEKNNYRARATTTTREILLRYPHSPEGEAARDFLKAHKL